MAKKLTKRAKLLADALREKVEEEGYIDISKISLFPGQISEILGLQTDAYPEHSPFVRLAQYLDNYLTNANSSRRKTER